MHRSSWTLALFAIAIMTIPCAAQENNSEDTVAAVEVGAQAPNFTVANDEEQVVELKDFLADDNLVLVFVRAHW